MIIEGELPPGARLSERALCDRLGVSRTPLREALRMLASDGLVDLTPNRGANVVRLSEGDIRDMFELMGALEALSGELACARITDDEVVQIKALTFQMLACHARRDLPAYYRLNHAIHDRINRAARNAALTQTYDTLNLRIQNLRFRSNFDEDKWAKAAREHTRMVEALEARDGAALARLLRDHLRQKGETVLDGLRVAPRGRERFADETAMNAPATQPLRFHPRAGDDLARRLRGAVAGDVLFDRRVARTLRHRRVDLPGHAGRRRGAADRRRRAGGVRGVPRAAACRCCRAAPGPRSAGRPSARRSSSTTASTSIACCASMPRRGPSPSSRASCSMRSTPG